MRVVYCLPEKQPLLSPVSPTEYSICWWWEQIISPGLFYISPNGSDACQYSFSPARLICFMFSSYIIFSHVIRGDDCTHSVMMSSSDALFLGFHLFFLNQKISRNWQKLALPLSDEHHLPLLFNLLLLSRRGKCPI